VNTLSISSDPTTENLKKTFERHIRFHQPVLAHTTREKNTQILKSFLPHRQCLMIDWKRGYTESLTERTGQTSFTDSWLKIVKVLFCGSTQKYGFYSSYMANCSFNAIISCATVILNILTIQALRKTTSLLKALNTLLPSLAVSDLGVV